MRTMFTVSITIALLFDVVAASQTPTGVDRSAMRQTLAPTGTLRAAFLGANPVQARLDRQTGEYTGLMPDIVKRIGMDLGVPVRLVAGENAAAVIQGVTSGTVDFGFLAFDVEREADIDYAGNLAVMRSSYVVTNDSPIRRASDADRPGLAIGAVTGATQQLFLSSTLRQATVRQFPSQPPNDQVERLLVSRELAAFGMNRQRALDLAAASPRLRALPDSFVDVAQSFVVRKGEAAKRTMLQQVAAELRRSGMVGQAIQKAGLGDSVAVAAN